MKKSLLVVLVVIAVHLNPYPSQAQVSLVKDINTSPATLREAYDYSNVFCHCGDYLFFPAMTVKGSELWRTDGTASGTIMVKDLNIGISDGMTGGIQCNGRGTVLFLGDDGVHGYELWASDGTATGTRLVKDVIPGESSQISILGMIGDVIFFAANPEMNGEWQIWKSDGTANNTTMVTVLEGHYNILETVSSGNHVFFSTIDQGSGLWKFWSLNGLTGDLKKLLEGKTTSFYQPIGNKIMFTVYDSVEKYSLWSSDGTPGGTTQIMNFGSGYLQSLLPFNGKLIFTVSGATWISDGTAAGTTQLTTGYTYAGTVIGDHFYGFGYDFSVASTRLFKTDGTTVHNIYLDGDLSDVYMNRTIPTLNNKLILQHYNENSGAELSVSDDAQQNFTLLKDIKPGIESSEPRSWAVYKDRVYFFADDGVHGAEIWFTDGTTSGTSLLKNIASGTASAFGNFPAIAVSGERLLLTATSEGMSWFTSDLYSSDGTDQGTALKFDFQEGGGAMFGKAGTDLIYFNLRKLYKANGWTESATLVKDFTNENYGFGYTIRPYYTLGNKLVFAMSITAASGSTGKEYWVTDGTEAGTHVLKDINPGGGNGISGNGAVLGSKLIFDGSAPAEGSELWSTDGTEAGTMLLKDINQGTASSEPLNFTFFKGKVFFTAAEGAHGNEVWVTDGTAEGTVLLADLVPGAAGSDARGLTVVGDHLLFIAYDAEKGWCLWKTDGTTEGTLFVKDIESGNEKNNGPGSFIASGNKFYFIAADAAYGKEIWVSDGTAQGTHVIDRVPGPEGSEPFLLTPIKELVYFKSQGALWRTNGTTQGTVKVADLDPMEIVYFNNWIYFTAAHPDYGTELFKVAFAKETQQITLASIENKIMGGAPFVIEATASSGLPVTITGEEELSLAGATATIVKPGTVKVRVQQPGDALFDPAPPVSQTFCILPVKPVVTLSSDPSGDPVLTSSSEIGNQWFRQAEVVSGATAKTFQPSENDTYKVQVTADGCMSDFSDEFYVIVTGIEETYSNITVYPNPARDVVYIKGNNAGDALLNIIDLQGKKLGTHQLQAGGLVEQSLADYPEGMYLIQVVLEKGTSYMKLVKQ